MPSLVIQVTKMEQNTVFSSLKLAGAYAAFANEGVYNEPYYVSKVVYQDGSADEIKPESRRAMKDSTAYMMTDMLKDVIGTGTAVNAQIPGLIQAGKNGNFELYRGGHGENRTCEYHDCSR